MMKLLSRLTEIWSGSDEPFIISQGSKLRFSDLLTAHAVDFSQVKQGDVVALIGDFEPTSILTFLRLVEIGAIIVPLTKETRQQHSYFFDAARVDVVIEGMDIQRREQNEEHELILQLRRTGHAGLVLFSTGTTGRPKAILHDLTLFLKRFETPRPTLRTVSFLLFDHIGGINTLLHTLFNRGTVVAPSERTVENILRICEQHGVEVLPSTPTFLRLLLMSGAIPDQIPKSLSIITYGTERMDQPTLSELCRLLPNVDFRQTFGMSELGIVRVKSRARDSLFMKIGGEGVETRIVDSVLQIRSSSRMLGYLNAPSPFDSEGWYDSKDVVEAEGDYIRVVGRVSDVINVGGLKFMASEVERVALEYPGVSLVKAIGRVNPVTGQHVELQVQQQEGAEIDKAGLQQYLRQNLQSHMIPRRIQFSKVDVGHRFKRA